MPVTTMSAITTSEAGKQTTMKQKATAKQKMTTEQTITEQQSTSKEVASNEQQSTSKEETTNKRQSTLKEETTTEQQSTSKEETTTKRLTILTSSENTMTFNDTAKSILNRSLCVCMCKYTNQTLKDSMEKRRKQLLLNKTELSSNIRKRMSAPDPRKSSTVVGTVAAVILVLFGLLFFSR